MRAHRRETSGYEAAKEVGGGGGGGLFCSLKLHYLSTLSVKSFVDELQLKYSSF